MPDALYIDTSGLIRITDKLKGMEKTIVESVDNVLNANAIEIATKAKQLAPVDIGGLRSSIAPETSELLNKHISVNANYAAYVEFGTGKYAAAYAGSLPDNWQQFALQFKGKGGGNMEEFLKRIEGWIKRNVTATYSVKTQKRTKTADEAKRTKQMAYLIARSILKNGIKPQPFLFPAYEQQRGQLLRDVETVLKSLS
jgi:HK97 gp10 family phage protein